MLFPSTQHALHPGVRCVRDISMAEYEINSSINAYLETTFANNLVENELAPTPVTGSFKVRTNNPFVSAADLASLQQIDLNEAAIDAARVARGLAPQFNDPGIVTVGVSRRVNDVSSRNTSLERNAWRAVGGVNGSLGHELQQKPGKPDARCRAA